MDIPKPGPRKPSVYTVTEEITPELAAKYLESNGPNRNPRAQIVNGYAKDMQAGLWHNTGQGIIFDTEGLLMDGQHRLAAIVKSGVTVTLSVTRNVPREAMSTLDVGKRRTVGDMLSIDGRANSAIAASVARVGFLYDSQDFSPKAVNELTSPQVYDYAHEHIEEIDRAAHRAAVLINKIPAAPSVVGSAYYLFHRVDVEACEQFFEGIINMRTDGEGDPRVALIRRLNTLRFEKTRANQLQVLDLFISAWNAWRKNETRDKLPLAKQAKWKALV